jgi:hypothetical protein
MTNRENARRPALTASPTRLAITFAIPDAVIAQWAAEREDQ